MAKKKPRKEAVQDEASVQPESPEDQEEYSLEIGEEFSEDKGSQMKMLAILALMVIAAALTYHLFLAPRDSFMPSDPVDEAHFKELFSSAGRVFILMDTRGVSLDSTRRNILQCGVDFAGSTGMVGRNVTYLAVDDSNCTATDTIHETSYCFTSLGEGMTIHITQGSETRLYSNGMVVGVGQDYITGTCGIHRV